ncbi:MAG: ATPase domain-containing protein [Nanoarchaeota archaeon]|nr:ATPase domain-containing protein [Nanoarchaeota archaeon]
MKKKLVKKVVKKTTKKVVKKVAKKVVSKSKISKKHIRVNTGIKNLDPLISGGLIKDSVTLVTGGPGSGKTIFSMQYLMEGLKNGETCLYITFEEKREKLYGDMLSFNWDFEKYEKKKQFFYLEYNPEQVKSLIEEGGGTVDQIITKRKVTRLVIDSVTSFSLLYQDELSKKEAALALFDLIDKWSCTAVLTAQAQSENQTNLDLDSLEFEVDSIIIIYHTKVKGKRIRGLEILKGRGTKHANKTMGLVINEHGLIVNPKEVLNI